MGFVLFFRMYIPNFSKIASPLYDLICKEVPSVESDCRAIRGTSAATEAERCRRNTARLVKDRTRPKMLYTHTRVSEIQAMHAYKTDNNYCLD